MEQKKQKKLAYAGLIFVIMVWGTAPLVTLYFYKFYSPTIRVAFNAFVCGASLLAISWKKRKLLNKTYFLAAIPTGFFMAVANVLQKIGLQYTTPTHYAFLENLSVLVVPILTYFFLKKKPGFLTVCGAVLCLVGSFILTDMGGDLQGGALGGDLLCACAGIFYGVNIAGTGAFAKKLYAPLYLMIQMFTEMVVSLVGAVAFHMTGMEPIVFDFDMWLILGNLASALIISTLCWLIRTNAMKHVDATVVAVMMPFSSVVTMILSVLTGSDVLTGRLMAGVVIGLVAIILSGLGDRNDSCRKQAK